LVSSSSTDNHGDVVYIPIKHEWSNKHPRDSKLSEKLKVKSLPTLSVANVIELLKAVMPLKQLTPEQATSLVVKHLVIVLVQSLVV